MRSAAHGALREAGETEGTLGDDLDASDCAKTFDRRPLEVIPAEYRHGYETVFA